jgi:1-deoxy-D-xylulose-5-phosphate reductoisomerase
MKKIVILGSTGSIGCQTLDIVRAFPDQFEVVGLAAGNNQALLCDQIQEFQPRHICCIDPPRSLPSNTTFTSMEDMASLNEVDLVMVATMGAVGLVPTLSALKHRKAVALSNK